VKEHLHESTKTFWKFFPYYCETQKHNAMHSIIISAILVFFISVASIAQEPATYEFKQLPASEMSEADLMQVASDHPEQLAANYNLAIHYYNQGVEIIEGMDYEAGFEANFATQEKVQELFKMARIHADKAHSIDANDMKTVKMLAGIYFGLNEMDLHKKFNAMIK
jgi:hypothetical protein